MPVKVKGSATKSSSHRNKDTVGVYLRLRPLKLDEPTLVKVGNQQVKTIPPDGSISQYYAFTAVFDNSPQSEIFDVVAKPIVEKFITSGKDGLIFTYGITGSGKTYTMEGLKSDPGLIYRTIDFIFNSIGAQQTLKNLIKNNGSNGYYINQETESLYPNLNRNETIQSAIPSVIKWKNRAKETSYVSTEPNAQYCLFMSLVELYNKQVFDLLAEYQESNNYHSSEGEKKRRIICSDKTGSSYVKDATEVEVKSADEAVEIYTRGVRRRKTGTTALNQDSSRGHCVLNLRLVQVSKSFDGKFNRDTLVSSQLCLVDLAGSERTKRSGATGEALHEAGNINNSLGALRQCIRALREHKQTVQYRDHSLTRLFQQYFKGHGTVRMVLCVKPTSEDFHENNIAMDFGLLTQEVPIDYASPPKMLKVSKSRSGSNAKKFITPEFESFSEFMKYWHCKLKERRPAREKAIEALMIGKNDFRQNLLAKVNETKSLKEQLEALEKVSSIVRKLDQAPSAPEMEPLHSSSPDFTESPPTTTHSSSEAMEFQHQSPFKPHHQEHQSPFKTAHRQEHQSPYKNHIRQHQHVEQSSPMKNHHHHHQDVEEEQQSPAKNHHNPQLMPSPTTSNTGVPVVNPRHNRSLSCSSMHWIHHKPPGTIDTGTVMKPKFRNGRSVKNLRSSDILRKDAAGYSVVHQDADSNGEVETSVYKGHIISTVCGGAQVILNDIETMRQLSPERKRAASDAHYAL